jgi:hypothetical protein
VYSTVEKFRMKVARSWYTGIGDANEFTMLLAYEDIGQRQKATMAMMQDGGYQAL